MRKKKENKLTAQSILDFFAEKPVIDRSGKDSSIKYGWPTSKEGLYMMPDIFNFFETKGYSKNDVEDIFYKYIQAKYSILVPKMEKGKTHFLKTILVINYNPDYKDGKKYMSNYYYYYDITDEKAKELKSEYEKESQKNMQLLIDKYNSINKTISKSPIKKLKEEKKSTKKPRTKKIPQIEVIE
jgi:ubiquitin C-terminal hydrolase